MLYGWLKGILYSIVANILLLLSVSFRLSKSKFRSSFHLSKKDIEYINLKGIDVIKNDIPNFSIKANELQTETGEPTIIEKETNGVN